LGRRSFHLELQTERELKLTWRALSDRADRGGRVYRTRDAAQPITRIVPLGQPMLGMVENVEDLSPELDLLALVSECIGDDALCAGINRHVVGDARAPTGKEPATPS
jgi:hypothetical protein